MLVLAVAFLALSFAEIFVLITVGSAIGAVPTLVLMILLSATGAWVVKHEGLNAWRRVVAGLQEGRLPTSEIADGFLILVSGLLLLTPGFITDAMGLLLALPPVRVLARGLVMLRAETQLAKRVGVTGARRANSGRRSPFPPPGERPYRRPGEDEPTVRRHWHDDSVEIIDLDAEEFYVDEPAAELERPDRSDP